VSIQSSISLIVLCIVKSAISTLDIIKNVLNEAGEFIGTEKKEFDAHWKHVLRYMNGEIRVSRASPLPYFNPRLVIAIYKQMCKHDRTTTELLLY